VAYLSEDYFRFSPDRHREGQRIRLSGQHDLRRTGATPPASPAGLFYTKYPELAEKSIEITETNVTGPAGVRTRKSPGRF